MPDLSGAVGIVLVLVLVLVIGRAVVCSAQPAPAEGIKELDEGNALLEQWRVDEAAAVAAELAKRFPTAPAVAFFEGMVRLYQGRYAEADALIQKAVQGQPVPSEVKDTVAMVQAVARMAANFQEARSEHFVLRFFKGKDAVLADEGLAVLEKSYAAVGADLKCFPKPPIIVEIYPDADSFCTASTLAKKDVERSGAIGICHFNRIMFTSPRALLRGYPWLDTLCHEYAHYVIIKKSSNTVPVWLHEGIAKYEECRWRRPAGGEMSLVSQTTLAQALEQNQLVSFERMHPTLARLDFREAQTAYAEMEALVEFVVKAGGPGALAGILDRAGKGESVEEAVAHTMKTDFKKFRADWDAYMRKMPLKKIPGLQVIRPKLAKGRENVGKDTGFEECENREAQNFALLGDLLRGQDLWEAAIIEYDKALQASGLASPQIMNKVAQVFTSDQKYDKAESILTQVSETYPDYSTTYANFGALYIVQKKYDQAAESLRKALEINPFNVFVRQSLVGVYSHLNRKAEARREAEKLAILINEVPTGEEQPHGK
jgi:tetratricopeptide (TPR) repeat protein